MESKTRKNRPQVRTAATQKKILDAAQAIFSEQGFEKTQLEQVAARAGYTRGAIYAHYKSKEDLFLALMEQRVLTKFGAVLAVLEGEPVIKRRVSLFKRWVSEQVNDQSWGTLMLEFKLYSLRRPESREKLLKLYEQMSSSSSANFIEILFGEKLTKAARRGVEQRLAVMGAVLSAVALESHFRPALLPRTQIPELFESLFDALVHA